MTTIVEHQRRAARDSVDGIRLEVYCAYALRGAEQRRVRRLCELILLRPRRPGGGLSELEQHANGIRIFAKWSENLRGIADALKYDRLHDITGALRRFGKRCVACGIVEIGLGEHEIECDCPRATRGHVIGKH